MKLIDKDAVLAEIKRHISIAESQLALFGNEDERNRIMCAQQKKVCEIILSFLNTLEVKEVDLEKETTNYLLYEHRSPLNEIMHKADFKSEIQYHKDIENAFKAGFELGMLVSNKAQKGE